MYKILLFGGSGFIGMNILENIDFNKFQVYSSYFTKNKFKREQFNTKVHWVEFDCSEQNIVYKIIKEIKPDYIINSIGYGINFKEKKKELLNQINFEFVKELLFASDQANIKFLIHLGSCFEYGDIKEQVPIVESIKENPVSEYGNSKLKATKYIKQNAKKFSTKFLTLRLFGTWGKYEPSFRLVPEIIDTSKNGIVLQVTKGEQVRDYSYASDIGRAICDLLKFNLNFSSGEIVNLGSGIGITLRDFIQKISFILGTNQLIQYGMKEYRENEMMYLVSSMQKWKELNFPKIHYTSLKEGLRKIINEK